MGNEQDVILKERLHKACEGFTYKQIVNVLGPIKRYYDNKYWEYEQRENDEKSKTSNNEYHEYLEDEE